MPTKTIDLSKQAKAELVSRIQHYFREELDQPIGGLPAEFLLEFFVREIGGHFYNRGLHDAHDQIVARLEDLREVIYPLEQPSDFKR